LPEIPYFEFKLMLLSNVAMSRRSASRIRYEATVSMRPRHQLNVER
jgi:hypothetical protein